MPGGAFASRRRRTQGAAPTSAAHQRRAPRRVLEDGAAPCARRAPTRAASAARGAVQGRALDCLPGLGGGGVDDGAAAVGVHRDAVAYKLRHHPHVAARRRHHHRLSAHVEAAARARVVAGGGAAALVDLVGAVGDRVGGVELAARHDEHRPPRPVGGVDGQPLNLAQRRHPR